MKTLKAVTSLLALTTSLGFSCMAFQAHAQDSYIYYDENGNEVTVTETIDQVESTTLQAVETTSLGSVGASNFTSSYSSDLWIGAQPSHVVHLLNMMPKQFNNPAAAILFRDTLATHGDFPNLNGNNTEMKIQGQKLMALAEAGFYEQAGNMAMMSNNPTAAENLQAVAYAELMRGDVLAACDRMSSLTSGRDLPFWLKLRAICAIQKGETATADLTISVLKEKKFFNGNEEALMRAYANGAKPKQPNIKTGIDLALVRLLDAPLPKNLNNLPLVAKRALAVETSPAIPIALKMSALYDSFFYATLGDQKLLRILNNMEAPSNGKTYEEGRTDFSIGSDAFIVNRVYSLTSYEQKMMQLGLMGAHLDAAKDDLPRYHALSHLYAPMLNGVNIDPETGKFAMHFAMAAILADNREVASAWLTALASDSANDSNRNAAKSLLSLWSLRDASAADYIARQTGVSWPAHNMDKFVSLSPAQAAKPNDVTRQRMGKIMQYALTAGREHSAGQSGLVSLALLNLPTNGVHSDYKRILFTESLNAADQTKTFHEMAFYQYAGDVLAELQFTSGPKKITTDARSGQAIKNSNTPQIVPRRKPE